MEGKQDVVNEKIQTDIESIKKDINKIYKSLYQDNGGEALQSKVNRVEAEKKLLKKLVFTFITLNGGILAALVKIAFV